ncbi:MAG: FAD-dependent oxidoreductase [Burkholderiales bacterium]|jgi:NAD(P)H-nitrite reductase large subunit|nr:FAD-dependent oxidoreductase [Burkholderiales bacterium]
MKHLILGNGPAGVIAAESIRKMRPHDEIIMVGSEPEPPYSRMAIPYLLVGNIQEQGTYLRKSVDHFERLNIHQRAGKATALDVKAKTVTLESGDVLAYDKLLIATGARPIRPPIAGMDLPGVHPCWTLADARKIIELAKPGARVLQMGAGFIGCIIMEALAMRGVKLTVVEMGNRMVPRMMTEGAGTMIKAWVQKKGVTVFTDTRVEAIGSGADAPLQAKLGNGQTLDCDLIISATGVKPNLDFIAGSGIEVDAGILVDDNMATNIADVYAAGDVTQARDFSTGEKVVNMIQPAAADDARTAAMAMIGKTAPGRGTFAMNVLDTLGLIAASFGQWWGAEDGQSVELKDEQRFKYLRLEFKGDVLIGATSLGLTDHVGVLRGLIQGQVKLGEWKDILLSDPSRLMEAYLASAQAQTQWGVVKSAA